MLLWGVIVNQSGRVQQSVIKFTIYSLPLSFVMPFAVRPTRMGITVQQEIIIIALLYYEHVDTTKPRSKARGINGL